MTLYTFGVSSEFRVYGVYSLGEKYSDSVGQKYEYQIVRVGVPKNYILAVHAARLELNH